MTCDPNWSNVELLLTFDGTNGSTVFTDLSPNNLPVTSTGGTVSTASPQFGTGCLAGNGTGQITVPSTAGNPLDLSQYGAWTIEFWMKASNVGGDHVMSAGNYGTTSGFRIYQAAANQLQLVVACSDGAEGPPPASAVTADGAWHAIAFVFDGTTFYMFVDGISQGNFTRTGTILPFALTWHIGGWITGSNFSGFIDELRVSNIARYTANYTPSAVAFPIGSCNVNVPNVVGDLDAVAQPIIVAAGLIVGTVTLVPNVAPVTTVLSESPVAGTSVLVGSAVNLTESLGLVAAPNVVGDTLAAATAAITSAGLVVGTVGYISNPALAGTIVDQSPPGGTTVSYGSAVDFDISLGSSSGGVVPNTIYDEAIFGAYFGGQLNLVEFTYMPGRTPFEQGATNLIINRYKQEPTDNRQRGVDFTQFVVPGETLQTVAVTGISAQGVPQASTNPLVTPLVVSNVIIDPVTNLKFGYSVSGGQNGVEYTVQFTCTTSIQTQTLEEVFSINIMIEDMFP